MLRLKHTIFAGCVRVKPSSVEGWLRKEKF